MKVNEISVIVRAVSKKLEKRVGELETRRIVSIYR